VPDKNRTAAGRSRFRRIVDTSLLNAAEAELELHSKGGHRLRAFFARRRVERLRSTVPVDDAPKVRENIASYGAGSHEGEEERPSGYDRRTGRDRRRRSEGHFPERRSGVDRRAFPAV